MNLDDMILQLCDITVHSLSSTPYTKPISDIESLFTLARENGLSGMIYGVLEEPAKSRFKKEHYLYFAQATKQNEAYEDLTTLFSNHAINHLFIKGSSLKRLYPEPYMRSMGDIDVVVQPQEMEKIKNLLEANQIPLLHVGPSHDQYTHPNGTIYEIHPHITRSITNHDNAVFDNIFSNATNTSKHRYELQPEYELIYLIYHMVKHFQASGVGLRSILDIGLFVEAHRDMDQTLLIQLATKTNLVLFMKTVLYVQKHIFHRTGLESIYQDVSLKPKDRTLFLRFIAISGVHGTGESFNRTLTQLGNMKGKSPRLRLFIRRIFPKKENLQVRYRYLTNYPFLYPIAVLSRLVHAMFTKRSIAIQSFKQLQIHKKDVGAIQALYDEIGL